MPRQPDDERAWGTTDFGHLCTGRVTEVARPVDADEVLALVRRANRSGTTLTPRGGGYSQSGQAVCADSLCLDLRGLEAVEDPEVGQGTLRCGPGATWRTVLARSLEHGLLPYVMPLNLDLTVGGTLSAGGFGSTSHLHGPCVSNVLEIDCVTGGGELASAGPNKNRALFDSILGGIGHCGILTSAVIKLRRAQTRVRTWFLLYQSLEDVLRDQHVLAVRSQVEHLEGLCSATLHGLRLANGRRQPFASWSYCLQVSKEYSTTAPLAEELISDLRFGDVAHTEDDDLPAFCARYDVRFESMRTTGTAEQPHPWLECLLPLSSAVQVIPEVLQGLPLFLGDLHRISVVAKVDRPRALVFPDGDELVSFAILPAGVHPAFLAPALASLKQVQTRLLASGGKRYLSGWLHDWDESAFRVHFGDYYANWQVAKRQFDPNCVLTSMLFAASGCHLS